MFRKILDHVGRRTIAWTVIIVFGIAVIARFWYLVSMSETGGVASVVIIYDPVESSQHPEVRAAYDQFFVENGIPHRWVTFENAILMPWDSLHRDVRAIVFPDRIAQRARDGFGFLLLNYARRGGDVIVVQDAGSEDRDGYYRDAGSFDQLLGVHYIHADQRQIGSFRLGTVHFTSPSQVDRWRFPAGKVDDDGYLIGYGYGRLEYPINVASVYDPAVEVDATDSHSPILAQRTVGLGRATYVNLPLGELRASGDSLPMQAILTTVLFDDARLPHLVPAPDGIGRIVINFHIDSNAEWRGIPNLLAHHLLRNDVRMEFDVTAGPDMLREGDGQGFHACDPRGRNLLLTLARYGNIGDHGGWAHNFFAFGIEQNRFTTAQMATYIKENSNCLESVLHKPIRSYAAPDGAHPQPVTTNILESLGIDAYYYTGDSGAPALRPFYDGRLVGKKSWAFPVMTMGTAASVQEMWREGIKPDAVRDWMESTLRFAEDQRAIYLLYTHSYDLRVHPEYIAPYSAFLDAVERDERRGLVEPITMPEAADFLGRYVETRFSYAKTRAGMTVRLDNPAGLRDIAFAIPDQDVGAAPDDAAVQLVAVAGGYHVYDVRSDETHLDVKM